MHNTKQLRCGRVLDRFGEIVGRLADMVERFTTTLDRLDTGFLPDGILDELPLPSQLGATRIGGIDLNKPRIPATLAAVLALAAAPGGFTVTDLATKVQAMTGQSTYTTRQAAYDLRKLRGKDLLVKPSRSHRYHLPPQPARLITALLTLREQVIGPILADVRSPRRGRKPATWTRVDRDYETLRINMQTLFHDLGITTGTAAASTTFCRSGCRKRLVRLRLGPPRCVAAACRELDTSDIFRHWNVAGVEFTTPDCAGHDQHRR